MRPDRGKLLLLDAPSMYFRAFHGVPTSVTAPDGSPVNAVRGLVDAVARVVRVYAPTHLVACMDADWRPAFRVAALPSYKAHRVSPRGGETVPDELVPQVPLIEQVLDAVGLARVGAAGYEADDVIGTLAARSPRPVDVVTGDRDLFQLVDDSRGVRVVYTAKGVGRAEVVDESAVRTRYGIPGRAYADFATLRGDPSDGLPGVPGVGDKAAAALVTRFGGLEGILAALDSGTDEGFPAGARRRLEEARDYLAVAPAVVRVVTEVPVPALDDTLPGEPRDPDGLVALSERWNLDGPLNRLLGALAAAQEAAQGAAQGASQGTAQGAALPGRQPTDE